MTPAEAITADWLVSKGYFFMPGLKAGRKEVDLVAVKLSSSKDSVDSKLHVEVSVSSTPFGGSKFYPEHCRTYIDGYYQTKFADPRLTSRIEDVLGPGYSRWLVIGKKPAGQQEIDFWKKHMSEMHHVQVFQFDQIVREFANSLTTRPIGGEAQLLHILNSYGMLEPH